MGFSLEDFTAASQPTRPVCTIHKIMRALDPKDRDVLTAAFSNPEITAVAIGAVLKANGHDVTQHTVARHRRGQCTCGG